MFDGMLETSLAVSSELEICCGHGVKLLPVVVLKFVGNGTETPVKGTGVSSVRHTPWTFELCGLVGMPVWVSAADTG